MKDKTTVTKLLFTELSLNLWQQLSVVNYNTGTVLFCIRFLIR